MTTVFYFNNYWIVRNIYDDRTLLSRPFGSHDQHRILWVSTIEIKKVTFGWTDAQLLTSGESFAN